MTIEMFQEGQRWRWRIRAKRDNRELGTSTDTYSHRLECIDAIRGLKIGVATAPVFDISQAPRAFIAT